MSRYGFCNLLSIMLIIALATTVQARLTFSYVSCGDSTDVIQPTDLAVSPDNVDPGAVITVSAKGTVTHVVDSGTVKVVAESDGAVVWEEAHDFCDFFSENWGVRCPVQPGAYSHTKNLTVTPDPIGDVFVVTTTGFMDDLKPMFCVQLVTAIRPGF